MSTSNVSVQLKKLWKKSKSDKSLRQFVNELIASGGDLADQAKQWYKNKDGFLNQKRSGTNLARAKLEQEATKASRRKKSSKKEKDAV